MQKSSIKRIAIPIISIIVLTVSVITVSAIDNSKVLTPTENQYLELRAVDVKNVANHNKQVTMELWGHDIEFARIQCAFFI